MSGARCVRWLTVSEWIVRIPTPVFLFEKSLTHSHCRHIYEGLKHKANETTNDKTSKNQQSDYKNFHRFTFLYALLARVMPHNRRLLRLNIRGHFQHDEPRIFFFAQTLGFGFCFVFASVALAYICLCSVTNNYPKFFHVSPLPRSGLTMFYTV